MTPLEWLAYRIGEIIGIAGLIGILMFTALYSRNSNWKLTRPGRSVMYLARGLAVTILFLVILSFSKEFLGGWRWLVEIIVYTPLAWASWNMYFSLRATLQEKPKFLFHIPFKKDERNDKK